MKSRLNNQSQDLTRSDSHRGIMANISWLLLARVCRKGCMWIISIIIAQVIGSEALGRMLAVMSFTWLFWMMIDGGLSELFIRDVASDNNLKTIYTKNLPALKGLLAVGSLFAMGSVAWFSVALRAVFALLSLFALALITESYMLLFMATFRIQERMDKEAVLWVLDGVLKVLSVVAIIGLKQEGDLLFAIGVAWFLTSLFTCTVAAWAVRSWWSLRNVFAFNLRESFQIIQRGMPLILAYGLGLMNARAMVFLVALKSGHADAGFFGAGERLLEAVQIIPIVLASVMLPVSARLASNSTRKLKEVVSKTIIATVTGAVLFSFLLTVYGNKLVIFVYGSDFLPMAQLMGLFGIITIPFFIKPVLEKILLGLHRHTAVWHCYAVVIISMVLAALTVIPSYGIKGAAICLLVAETACVTVLGVVLLRTLSNLKDIDSTFDVAKSIELDEVTQ